MIWFRGSCETMTDCFGNKPRVCGFFWKRIHLGLVKIWLGYEMYNIIDEESKKLVVDENHKPIQNYYLSTIEITKSWK